MNGQVEMIRALRSAPQSAVKAPTQAANQLQALLLTAPEELRHRLRDRPTNYESLSEEIAELNVQLERLVAEISPELISRPAIGMHHAATLLSIAGDNPEPLKSEASFASLCGVSPIEASSGKVVRHRLNRGGDREANRALCT